MSKQALFIGATGQNIGKTTICLGLLAALGRRFKRVGFIKPVGQVHEQVGPNQFADKDAILFKHVFLLPQEYRDLSPVIIPSHFTRQVLDGEISTTAMKKEIQTAFDRIAAQSDYTLVEGTGHIGVGSILDLNNAQVAAALRLSVVLVVSGGLGSALDNLALNLSLCEKRGVTVKGVILNRVLPDKRDMILEYFPKALKPLGIPLLGAVPYCSYLTIPTLEDFEALFHTKLLTSSANRWRHFREVRLVDVSADHYLTARGTSELVIASSSRSDLIEAIIHNQNGHQVGLILTGSKEPSYALVTLLNQHDIPALYVPLSSYETMQRIHSFTAKIRREDTHKVEKAICLVEQHVDLDLLCNASFG